VWGRARDCVSLAEVVQDTPDERVRGERIMEHQRLEVPSVLGMRIDPVVHGEATSAPRQQELDPLLAQQPPAPKSPRHLVAEQLLGRPLVHIRHRSPVRVGAVGRRLSAATRAIASVFLAPLSVIVTSSRRPSGRLS
jgi:hypothetical protein